MFLADLNSRILWFGNGSEGGANDIAGRLSRDNISTALSRRAALGAAVAVVAAPAIAEECRIGPPEHPHGPNVWMNMDQTELDAAYDQAFYAPLRAQIIARAASNSELTRKRLGPPRREA
ncbi:hypothetical protein [Bradyrhizobium sp.]|uniref:hypothetical protein n=1 Tax=Bradyrhizobium sp. TaxID=376 RepID=UPI003C701E0C